MSLNLIEDLVVSNVKRVKSQLPIIGNNVKPMWSVYLTHHLESITLVS